MKKSPQMTRLRKILMITGILLPSLLLGQGNIEDLLYTEVDNLNPVYKPVVGFGIGTFNFFGDVRDPQQNPLNGTLGYKINLATFIDNKQYLRANFYFMYGALSGNERSHYLNPDDVNPYAQLQLRNFNFRSELLIFGVNLNYDFDNFYKKYRKVHPFVSVGFETLVFNSKTDIYGSLPGESTEDIRYQYWPDGTIRNLEYRPDNLEAPELTMMHRDYRYETILRGNDVFDFGAGDYPQYTFAIPVDAGLDFWIGDRLLFRIGASYHFTFSDYIDHVSWQNTQGRIGDKWNDDFMYTYVSLHLDLFSSKKTLAIQRLFADIELDLTLIGDEDNDGYMDGWDQCPETPFGVKTDTTGCPLDDDYDGVPNYLDDEPNSRYGAYVDERGVEISEADLIAQLDNSSAVPREDVPLYLRTPGSYASYQQIKAEEIPEKFIHIDTDGDGYISFDEILDEIDNFFDFESNLNSEDIYELNNFFFAQ
jgi:hypothetical protein